MMNGTVRVAAQALRSVLVCMALAACARPYDIPVITESNSGKAEQFPGVLDLAEAGSVRVIWVHGMCTHKEIWAIKRDGVFGKSIGLPAASISVTGERPGIPERVTSVRQIGNHRLEVRYLIWSPLADDAKIPIQRAETVLSGDEKELTRASLNAQLKRTLINDCLSDAVIYTGHSGDRIRAWMKSEVCDALDGSLAASGSCDIKESAKPQAVVFVAESLGSKMLSDALQSIYDSSNRGEIAERLDDVQLYFMLANQIPLLSAADAPKQKVRGGIGIASASGNDDLLGIFAKARQQAKNGLRATAVRQLRPLRFVAFSDPNDLLSYRLIASLDLPPSIKVTNIAVSNDSTYLGLLERPDTAHCGYGWNSLVADFIAKGYDGTLPVKRGLDVAHECGLGASKEPR